MNLNVKFFLILTIGFGICGISALMGASVSVNNDNTDPDTVDLERSGIGDSETRRVSINCSDGAIITDTSAGTDSGSLWSAQDGWEDTSSVTYDGDQESDADADNYTPSFTGTSEIEPRVGGSGNGGGSIGETITYYWTVNAAYDIVKVVSLTPDTGTEIDDGDYDDSTKSYILCKESTGDVTVTATPSPDLAEEDLPSSWSLTGGTGNGKLTRTVDKTSAGTTTLTATCGTSSNTATIHVSEVEKIRGSGEESTTDLSDTNVATTSDPIIYIASGCTITFNAVSNPTASSGDNMFPPNQPTWGGEADGGSGNTQTVTFSTASSSNTDFKYVKVRCGDGDDWKTLRVLVVNITSVSGNAVVCKNNTATLVAHMNINQDPQGNPIPFDDLTWSGNGTFSPASGDNVVTWTPPTDFVSSSVNDLTVTATYGSDSQDHNITVVEVDLRNDETIHEVCADYSSEDWSDYDSSWSEVIIPVISKPTETEEKEHGYEFDFVDPELTSTTPVQVFFDNDNSGTIENDNLTDFEIKYKAMTETKADLRPIQGPDRDKLEHIKIAAFLDDGRKIEDACGKEAFVKVLSVFRYLVDVEDDHEKAIDFVLWKYSGILSGAKSNRSRISYDEDGSGYGETYPSLVPLPGYYVDLSPNAFLNENTCASTIGHEWVHWSNNNGSPDHWDKDGPYHWEYKNMSNTGMKKSDINTEFNARFNKDKIAGKVTGTAEGLRQSWGVDNLAEYQDND